MPIRVRCKCGRTLSLKDEFAGRSVRCPECKTPLRVPAGGSAATASRAGTGGATRPKAAAAPRAAAKPASDDLSGLFDEEGMGTLQGPVCRGCGAEMRPGSVICVRCGLHQQTGQRFSMEQMTSEGTKSEFGVAALDSAAAHMQRDRVMQKSLQGAGMPWWALSIVLLGMVSICVVGVFVVNGLVGTDIEDDSLSGRAAQTPILVLLGAVVAGTATLLNQAAWIAVLYHAFKESAKQGLMVMFLPLYVFVFLIQRWGLLRQYFQLMLLSLFGAIGGWVMIIVGLGSLAE